MSHKIGVVQGVGLVVASMIGSGLFVSTGFMLAQGLTSSEILLEWLIGGLWAFCGAILYSHIAQVTPLDGGEPIYIRRYLSESLGYIVSIITILIGFICPIVFDSLVTGHYLSAVSGWEQPEIMASAIILFFVGTNYIGDRNQFADVIQQILVFIKFCIVFAIIAIGFWWLNKTDTFTPYTLTFTSDRIQPLLGQQYWVVYAFSGFNAAIYIAERFKQPSIQVQKSIYYGLFLVLICYMLINHIFVQVLLATDIPQAALNDEYNQITLCHLLFQKMFASSYGNVISSVMIFIFLSSISVMFQLVIPICVSLSTKKECQDHNKQLTKLCVLIVGGFALLLIWSTSISQILASISFIVYLVSSLTMAIILLNKLPKGSSPKIRLLSLGYIITSILLLAYGVINSDIGFAPSVLFASALIVVWLYHKKYIQQTSIVEPSSNRHHKYNA